jgi:hypothetical protein
MVNDDGYYMVNDYLMVIWLVVFRLPLWKKYWSIGIIIPNMMGKINQMFQSTNQKCSHGCFGVSCYISLAFCREQLQTIHGLLNCQILVQHPQICITTLAEQSDTNLVNLWFTGSLPWWMSPSWGEQIRSCQCLPSMKVASCLVFWNSFWRQQLMGS